jgi:hypothetical protein
MNTNKRPVSLLQKENQIFKNILGKTELLQFWKFSGSKFMLNSVDLLIFAPWKLPKQAIQRKK